MRKCTVLKYMVSIGSQELIDDFLLFGKKCRCQRRGGHENSTGTGTAELGPSSPL